MPEKRTWEWPWENPNWIQASEDGKKKKDPDDDADEDGDTPRNTGSDEEKGPVKNPPQYTIESAEIIVPDEGLKEGLPYRFKGKARRLEGTAPSSARISVQALYRYKDKEQICGNPEEVEINKDSLRFEGEFDELFEPDAYYFDKEKAGDAKYRLVLKLRGGCIDKDAFSNEVELPMATNWSVKDGMIIHKDITLKKFPDLEHGTISKVNAIVLHRTGGNSLDGIFSEYKNDGKNSAAAHFYIDAKGKIFQVGRIDRILYHVGEINSKDEKALNGNIDWINNPKLAAIKKGIESDAEEIKYLSHLQDSSFTGKIILTEYYDNLFQHEKKKNYPRRWPYNADSIGIEVTGVFDKKTKSFAELTPAQEKSFLLLVHILVEHLKLDSEDDIYPHGGIAKKEPVEGKELLQIIKNNMVDINDQEKL